MMASNTSVRVRKLDPTELSEAADVLVESFRDYPVMRFVLGDRPGYGERLKTLVDFFVRVREYRKEILLGVDDQLGLAGVAMVSFPGGPASPAEVGHLRDKTWSILGDDARRRYEEFGDAAGGFEVPESHIHLNMIGIRERARGRGYGRRLLEAVHRISEGEPESQGISLTTELMSNVSLYLHFGYEFTGRADVAGAFTTWGFYRRNS